MKLKIIETSISIDGVNWMKGPSFKASSARIDLTRIVARYIRIERFSMNNEFDQEKMDLYYENMRENLSDSEEDIDDFDFDKGPFEDEDLSIEAAEEQ